MLKQPVSMARGQASDIAIKAKEVMVNRKVSCELIARAYLPEPLGPRPRHRAFKLRCRCGKSVEEVMNDASRTKYLQYAHAAAVVSSPPQARRGGRVRPHRSSAEDRMGTVSRTCSSD